MEYRVKLVIIVILLIFIFSPLAVASERPSLFEMLTFYTAKLGQPDHVIIEYCTQHPFKWAKRTYIWEGQLFVVFIWVRGEGWAIMNMQSLKPTSV